MTRNDETKKTTLVVDAGVIIETLREREPWGPGRFYYAEVRDARTDATIYRSELGRRREAQVDALAECFLRGLEVL